MKTNHLGIYDWICGVVTILENQNKECSDKNDNLSQELFELKFDVRHGSNC